MKNIIFIIFIFIVLLSFARLKWNYEENARIYQENARIYKGNCILPQCTTQDFETICAGYPYINNTEIKNEVYRKLGCIFCPGEWINVDPVNKKCNEKIPTRIS